MIIHLRVASLLSLDDLEDKGVLCEDPEHVDDAGHHPGLHRGQALRLYWIFAELFARQIIFARHCYVDICCYYPVSCVTAGTNFRMNH